MCVISPILAATIGAGALGIGAGMGVSAMTSGNKDKAPTPAAMPEAPKTSDASDAAEKASQARAKKAQSYKSVFSSPLGLADQAQVAKKTLLGQ